MRVGRRCLAADSLFAAEQPSIPVDAISPPSQRLRRIDKKQRLLRARHVNLGMERKIEVQTRRASFRGPDDNEIRQTAAAVVVGYTPHKRRV